MRSAFYPCTDVPKLLEHSSSRAWRAGPGPSHTRKGMASERPVSTTTGPSQGFPALFSMAAGSRPYGAGPGDGDLLPEKHNKNLAIACTSNKQHFRVYFNKSVVHLYGCAAACRTDVSPAPHSIVGCLQPFQVQLYEAELMSMTID